jgi:hypothetical protein
MELHVYKDKQIDACKGTDHSTVVLVVIDTHFTIIGLQELTCGYALDFKDTLHSNHQLQPFTNNSTPESFPSTQNKRMYDLCNATGIDLTRAEEGLEYLHRTPASRKRRQNGT